MVKKERNKMKYKIFSPKIIFSKKPVRQNYVKYFLNKNKVRFKKAKKKINK